MFKILIFLSIITAIAGCGHRVPGDPFGYYRPEELVTVCQDETTRQFNRSMSEKLINHHLATLGQCPISPIIYPCQ